MNNLRKDYYANKKLREKQWLYLILLSPFLALSVWITYLSLLVLARALPELHFGHGSEVLLVLPMAIFCIVRGIFLVCKLYKTRFKVDD